MSRKTTISILLLLLIIAVGFQKSCLNERKLEHFDPVELSSGMTHINPHGVIFHFKDDKAKTVTTLFPISFNKVQNICYPIQNPCIYFYNFDNVAYNIFVSFDPKKNAAVIELKKDLNQDKNKTNFVDQVFQSLLYAKKII